MTPALLTWHHQKPIYAAHSTFEDRCFSSDLVSTSNLSFTSQQLLFKYRFAFTYSTQCMGKWFLPGAIAASEGFLVFATARFKHINNRPKGHSNRNLFLILFHVPVRIHWNKKPWKADVNIIVPAGFFPKCSFINHQRFWSLQQPSSEL